MSVSKDFEELFAFLTARRVKFLVVGAHAVAFHAKPRFTKDIDVLIEPTAVNASALLLALEDFGFGSLGLQTNDFTQPGRIVQLGVPPNRVDLLTEITGVSFTEAWAGRVAGRFGSQEVHYIGRRELLRNKRAIGRPQDRIDADWLVFAGEN